MNLSWSDAIAWVLVGLCMTVFGLTLFWTMWQLLTWAMRTLGFPV